jgi:hypothetical protein
MTEQEKIEYLNEHLQYEVKMLRWSYYHVQGEPPSPWRNAFIEVFAVHARGPYDFCVSNDARDVLARDYVSDFEPPRPKDEIRDEIELLNKQIFHTSKARTAAPGRKFNMVTDGRKVLGWVEDALAEFVKELPKQTPPYPADWLPPA